MNRNARTLLVVAIGLVAASVSSFLVYRTVTRMPVREVEVAHNFAVVAARPLTLGARVAKEDVKLVAWPASNPVPNGFSSIDQVVDRGLITPLAENEPLTTNNVATAGAGAGLPPTIPPGMRAISVRVNEVIGVAGFVVPGTRVDVMAILRQGSETVARVVVSNVQVLTAGTRYEQDVAKDGKAIPSTVVTLMVSPEDAAKIGLAGTEGQILLTLRNPLDVAQTNSAQIRSSSLAGDAAPALRAASSASAAAPPRARPRQTSAVAPPPAAPAPPPAYKVEAIRAAKRSEETLR